MTKVTPNVALRVLDRAIQAHGGWPMARMKYTAKPWQDTSWLSTK